jgi:hypothetical protein
MRFPETNSRGWLILKTLRRQPMTIWQGIEQHGEFETLAKPHGVGYAKVLKLYGELVERGCLVREGIKYRLSLAALHKLEKLDAKPLQTSVATPRNRDIWKEPTTPTAFHRNELTGRYTQLNFKLNPKISRFRP